MHKKHSLLPLVLLGAAPFAPASTLSIDSGSKLSWLSVAGTDYQLQQANDPAGPWVNLGSSIEGDGTEKSIYFDESTLLPHLRHEETTIVPGAGGSEAVVDGGFELGGGSSFIHWTTAGSAAPERWSSDARTGSHSMRGNIENVGATPQEALLFQFVAAEGGSVSAGESYDFSFWAKQIRTGPSYIQQYEVQWLNASNSVVGSTGLQNFSGGSNWTEVTRNNLTAPLGATNAVVKFRLVTGAELGGLGEVLIDDVSLYADSGAPPVEEISYTSISGQPVGRIHWESRAGVAYQPMIASDLSLPSPWTTYGSPIIGTGGTVDVYIDLDADAKYLHVTYEGDSEPPDLGDIVPLFSSTTTLEPEVLVETPTALITRFGDRARDRHARESQFKAYDHYLSWYWEDRTMDIEIIDYVAKGGSKITVNYTTLTPLSQPEFRAFFKGDSTVAEYHYNVLAPLVGTNQYSVTIDEKLPEYRDLQIGDRMEIEISMFLRSPMNGRNNYYGTTFLYIVGEGIVPWEGRGTKLDSHKMPEEGWLGGYTTLPYQYSDEPDNHFKQLAGNISPTSIEDFMLGRRLHHTNFETGTHSEPNNPIFATHIGKAGPKFIARSCVDCHTNNGRSLPPSIGTPLTKALIRVGANETGSPHPTLGTVLQSRANGSAAEGQVSIDSYTTVNGTYGDGSAYTLKKPNFSFTGTAPEYYSIRMAQQLVGLGLLEAIEEASILALADPGDGNSDGISGRVREVTDPETGDTRIGRFGSRAAHAKVSHQIASALNTDIGIATDIFPTLDGDASESTIEINSTELDQMNRYIVALGVSARRDLDNTTALTGEQLFNTMGCVQCHTPTLTTGPYHPIAELRNQTIHPYTDLLLHDMGSGLADNMGEDDVLASEWRTPPLWSIGLTNGISGGEAYLHDGRAQTLEEAILWHGGEGETAKEAFRTATKANRDALIEFLKSL